MLSNEAITVNLLRERLALTAFFATVTRHYHLAEDVFQDVCVKAISHTTGFESLSHLLNWARLTGKNRAIDLLRTRDGKYQGLSEEVLDALASHWPDRESEPSQGREALAECLKKLTPNNRDIVRLRYFEGRSGMDIAELLGRKLETVYQALARIHKALGQCVRLRLLESEG